MSPIATALAALRTAALAILARLVERAAAPTQADATGERRVQRALSLLAAFTALLNGDPLYHRPASFIPPEDVPADLFTSAPRASRPRPALTEASRAQARAAGRLAYLRRIFATVPTATLAIRLARRLGLTEQSQAWPHALTEILDPPATLALRLHPRATPRLHPKTLANLMLRAASRIDAMVASIMAEPPLPHPPLPHPRE